MANRREDKEIQQYRDLMPVPDRFEDGFGPKMIFAALFLGLVMVPGSIYLSLFIGGGMGPAAQWVTVILFSEVARRSMKELRVQEVFLLFYMVGIAISGQSLVKGGIMSELLWNQYLIQSQPAISLGVASHIPWWVAPQADVIEQTGRTFFASPWIPPIFFITGLMILQRIDQFGLGYALYRLTAHVEKLPFPMAPVGALGITALAEGRDTKQKWRWKCFSIGGMLGMVFGAIYIGIPAISGSLFNRSVQILPIPWLDFTASVSTPEFMPAVPMNLSFDLGLVILGMVLPFWAVIGGFIGLLITWALNPLLYEAGVLTTWQPGMKVVDTLYSNTVDFYLSFGIGIAFAIFLVSLGSVLRPFVLQALGRGKKERADSGFAWGELLRRDPNRGDLSVLVALSIYVFSALSYIGVCVWLMPGDPQTGQGRFPWLFFLGFAFLYQPIISYVNAKLEGMVGQNVQIPMVQQAAFILSGYRGAEIWFAPIPMNDYSESVRQFRVMELTGTRILGLIKVEILAVPVLVISSLVFCEMIWRLAPIPSAAYPFADEVWRLNALNFSLMATSTMDGASPFMEAIKPGVIGVGFGAALGAFAFLSFLQLPTFLIYGAVRGLNQSTPGGILLELLGALIGRFYLQKKLGHQRYKTYMMVVFAGFAAGVGIIGMMSVAIALLSASTSATGF